MAMKIMVLPREDMVPYQALLYGEMRRRGARISYLGTLTPSHTLNLLLLPLELVTRRLAGARIIHLHWVFVFALPGAERFPILRRVAQVWFNVFLHTTRVLGIRLVWTAHNVLPHRPVFADDIRARRQLVGTCDLVLAHSHSALAELVGLGITPRRTAVIPIGPFGPPPSDEPLTAPGAHEGSRRLLFFGKVEEYKGVEDLLAAFAAIPADLPVNLIVAGECGDQRLRSRLRALAKQSGERVAFYLERVAEEEVASLLADADVVVLPFRRATTSASAMLALCHGRPIVVPDLAAFVDLPDGAVVRYDGTIQSLTKALVHVILLDTAELRTMSAAARAYSSAITWEEIAAETMDKLTSMLADEPHATNPS